MMRSTTATVALMLVLGCGRSASSRDTSAGNDATPDFEPPVVTNPESPVSYPVDMYEQQVEGTVVLRLFVDEKGAIVPESTRVAETSGAAALDSAALYAVPDLRFAPARRNGQAVATTFLQPVRFRRGGRNGGLP